MDETGICLRCAGARIFSLTVNDKSIPPSSEPTTEAKLGPDRIGPYAIIGELGRGGMGSVYLAQHTELGRIVALKVIPSRGGATSGLEMRFLREARTVARLSHPNIIAVHDAGHADGHAFFAMDYFEDGDLARRLRSQPYSPREAAKLMQSVAEAIAYSHAAGVLHRDLKPSNVLLDGGAPRVADFGLATELDSAIGLTARTAVLGTPHYLAPEALSRGSAAQGVTSDVYSLGVILHEMLTGRTPFAGASPAELPGLLARAEAPDLRLLAPQVPTDLATICAKCLEFEATGRYPSAAALADDLRRFNASEPIKARPVSATSQLIRWARRRPALAATWVLSFSLAIASLTAAVLINRERLRTDAEAASNLALVEFLGKDVLGQATPSGEPDRDLKLRTALDRARENIPRRFVAAPIAEASVRLILANIYSSLGEYAEAERQLRRTVALRKLHLGAGHPDSLQAVTELATVLNSLGRNQEAARLIRPTVVTLVQTLGPEHPHSISAMETEALVVWKLGQATKAESLARHVLEISRRALGPEHELTRSALIQLSSLASVQGKTDEAIALTREAVASAEHALGPRHPHTLSVRVDLVTLGADQGRIKEAETALRELHRQLARQLGPDHPESLRTLSNLGSVLIRLDRHQEAEETYADLVGTRLRTQGPEHPSTLLAMKQLALARGRNGHLDEAIFLMRELIEIGACTLGPEHPTILNYQRNLGSMLISARRYEEALVPAETAYRTSLREFGPDDLSTLADAEVLANALGCVDRDAEAVPILRQASESLKRSQPEHWRTHLILGQLGRSLARDGKLEEAEPLLRESYSALMAHPSALPASRRQIPNTFAEQLARLCTTLGRSGEAAEWQARATVVPTAGATRK